MAWNYATLSKTAKAFGGPEKLVEHIVVVSKKSGQLEMVPITVGSLFIGVAIGIAITKDINYFKKRKDTIQTELEVVKMEIINEIKRLDASRPKPVNLDCNTPYQSELSDE